MGGEGRVVEPPTKSSDRGGLDGTLIFKGGHVFEGRGWVSNFYKEKKLKSEIFNDKISCQTKFFFSTITKNSNWEILT